MLILLHKVVRFFCLKLTTKMIKFFFNGKLYICHGLVLNCISFNPWYGFKLFFCLISDPLNSEPPKAQMLGAQPIYTIILFNHFKFLHSVGVKVWGWGRHSRWSSRSWTSHMVARGHGRGWQVWWWSSRTSALGRDDRWRRHRLHISLNS